MSGGPTASGLDYLANLMTGGAVAVNAYYVCLIPELEPGFTSTGDDIDEPQFDDYARAQILNESSAWTVGNQTLTNNDEVTFPTAASVWGSIQYWAIADSDVSGQIFWVGEFYDPLYVDVGGVVTLDPGTLTLWFEGNQWKMGQ